MTMDRGGEAADWAVEAVPRWQDMPHLALMWHRESVDKLFRRYDQDQPMLLAPSSGDEL